MTKNPVNSREFGVAVSGGVDSMALVYLLSKTLDPSQVKAYIVNHNLRPESTQEAEITQERLKTLGVNSQILSINWQSPQYPYHVKNSNTDSFIPSGTRMETFARAERYSLLGKAMQEDRINTVMLGHHANDLQETTLFRFSRHSGVVGMAGIHKNTTFPFILDQTWSQYQLIRPLLDVPKERLIDTCKEFNVEWEEDPTNQLSTGLIQRNVIRSILDSVNQPDCPEELKPLQFESFQKFCNHMDAHRSVIMQQTRTAMSKAIKFIPHYGLCEILVDKITWKDNPYIAARVLGELNQWVKCSSNPPRLNSIRSAVPYFMDPTTIKPNKQKQYLVQITGALILYTPKENKLVVCREPLTQSDRIKFSFTVPKPDGIKNEPFSIFWDARYFITCQIKPNYIDDPKFLVWCKMSYPMLTNLKDIEHTFKIKPMDHDTHFDRLVRLLRIYKLRLTDPEMDKSIKFFYRTLRDYLSWIPLKSARSTLPVMVLELKGTLDDKPFCKEVVIGFPTLRINFMPHLVDMDGKGKFRRIN